MPNFDLNISDGLNKLEALLSKLKELKSTGKEVGKPMGESLKGFTSDLEKVIELEKEAVKTTNGLANSVENLAKTQTKVSTRTKEEVMREVKVRKAFNKEVEAEENASEKRRSDIQSRWDKNRQSHRIAADKKIESEIERSEKRRSDIQSRWDKNRQSHRIAADKKEVADKKKHAKEVEAEIERSAKRRADIQKRWDANRQKHRIAADKKEVADKKKLAKQTDAQTKSNKGLLGSILNLVKAYGVLQATMLFSKAIRSAFDLAKTFDSLNFSMQKTVGTSEEIASTNTFLIRLAKDYGAELVTLTNRYVKFFVAAKQSGVALKDTQDIFETFTKVSGVMGLRADELNGIFLALEQMLSKGKITTEELRRQLGERLPGALGIMATSMGVTIEELDKMLKKGEVISKDVLPDFAKAVEAAYGIESVDKVNTLVASQNRMTTAWQLFVKSVTSDTSLVASAFNKISQAMTAATLVFGDQASKLSIIQEQLSSTSEKIFDEGVLEKWGKAGEDFLKRQEATSKGLVDARTEIAKLTLSNFEGVNNEKIIAQEKIISELTAQRVKQKNELTAAEIVFARTQQESALESFQFNKKRYEDGEAAIKQFEELSWSDRTYNQSVKSADWKAYDKAIKNREKNTQALAIAQLELNKIQQVLNKENDKVTPESVEQGNGKAFRERLKNEIAINESVIKTNEISFEKQEELARINSLHRKAIAISLNSDIKKDTEKSSADLEEANEKKNSAITKAELKFNDDLAKIQKKRVEKAKEAIEEQLQDERDRYAEVVLVEAERFNALSKAQKETEQEQIKHNSILLQNQIEHEEKMLAIRIAAGNIGDEEKAKMLKTISDLKAALKDLDGVSTTNEFSDWIEKNMEGLRAMEALVHSLSDLSAAFTERRLQDIEKEQEALEKAHEAELERLDESTERSLEATAMSDLSAEEKAERAEGIRQSAANSEKLLQEEKEKRDIELEKKEIKAKQKQAKIDKAAALVSIALNTAVAITRLPADGGLLGLAAIPIVAAIGAVQAATVLATPLPQFAEGGEMDHDGKMVINDHESGRQEFINRKGKILTTNKKNAIVDGKKGDIIYKDYNTMAREMMIGSVKSSMIGDQNIFSSSGLNSVDLSGIEGTISTGIKKGFKGVKNINNIQVKNSNHALYLLSKQQ